MVGSKVSDQSDVLFANPFQIEDLQVFDDDTLLNLLTHDCFGITCQQLAYAMQGLTNLAIQRLLQALPDQRRLIFYDALQNPIPQEELEQVRQQVLDAFFWELIYWKKPELYEELTQGEHLHAGIFQKLKPELSDKTILDAGAGCGRASFECLHAGAALVYAVEPSPGLLHILKHKLTFLTAQGKILPRIGRFDALPLEDNCVDVALSCSAFTRADEQGGVPGLAELKRVTKPGGKIVIIWPRTEDHSWFKSHGFHYVSLPVHTEMSVQFRSLETAIRCARLFYAHNQAVIQHLQITKKPAIPFSLIGMNPPHDYFWLNVTERM